MRLLELFAALILLLVVVPSAFAQDQTTNTVRFNNFSFSYDAGLGSHVGITQYLTSPADVFPEVGAHTHFVMGGEQPVEDSIVGIRVFRLDDLAAYDHTQQQVEALQALLAEQRDLMTDAAGTENPLPFLPVIPAGQTLRARAQYISTPEVTGISYVTAYQQAAEPLLQNSFLYTFQGISADGAYYVSAVFRVSPEAFPTEMPTDFDYQTFVDGLPNYLATSAAQLDAAAPEAFVPPLATLDAVIQSFAFES